MRPGPSSAAKVLIETISVIQEPRPALEWLTEICIIQGWSTNNSDALEAAEKWVEQFLNNLRQEINQLYELGRFSPYTFNTSSEYLIQGCAFVEPSDNDIVRAAKAKRSLYGDYWSMLGKLDPRDFEALCTGIIDLIGVDNPYLTKYSADEGIDFFGKLRLDKLIFPDDFFPGIQRQLTAWMIGQAKHYNKLQVATNEIRDLVGSVVLAKNQAFGSVEKKYEELKIRACDPVFHLFITTGYLSSSCWRLLRSSGVIGMDGEMVASFLADRSIGIKKDEFDEDSFREWILKYKSTSSPIDED